MIDERLKELNITLPNPPQPAGAYTPVTISKNLAFVSGQVPMQDGAVIYKGVVNDANIDMAKESAKLCAINILAQLQKKVGLDRVQKFIRLSGFVRSDPDFTAHPQVIDAASNLIFSVFGERGRHTRVAVGTISLPLGSMTEIDAIVQI
ncbi:MAG: RidA family protein [Cenarchaeum sp. SB0663_bin_5]|nr:RidA family protein [Cenarchaeum sp. SB0663_bin_5]MYH04498.1 RidA family protein [Cenarchaeum sp. SB0675_bin_21]MYL11299.1 RidA family protein [Cenarchaeum sp. SB0669_bin_11]